MSDTLPPSAPDAVSSDLDGLLKHLESSREFHLREAEKFQRQRYTNGFYRAKGNAQRLEQWIAAVKNLHKKDKQ